MLWFIHETYHFLKAYAYVLSARVLFVLGFVGERWETREGGWWFEGWGGRRARRPRSTPTSPLVAATRAKPAYKIWTYVYVYVYTMSRVRNKYMESATT